MSEIQEKILLMLGEMKSNIGHIRSKVDIVERDVKILNETLIETTASARAAHKRVDDLQKETDKNTTFRNKGMGIVGFVGFMMTGLGTLLGVVIGKGH